MLILNVKYIPSLVVSLFWWDSGKHGFKNNFKARAELCYANEWQSWGSEKYVSKYTIMWYIHMMEYYYIAGFLNLSTSGPCCGDYPVHCRMASSNFPPTSSCDIQKMNVSRHYQMSPRGKIVPGWQSLLSSNEKEQILTTHKQRDNMEDSHKHNLGQKGPYTEECVIHNAIYTNFKTREN